MLNTNNIFGVRRPGPKSNLQRQREFRERNPHYYRDLHRKRKALGEALVKLMAEHPEMAFAEAYNIVTGKAPAPQQPVAAPTPLALPAPEEVLSPTVTITLPDAFVYEPAKIKIVPEAKTLEASGRPED